MPIILENEHLRLAIDPCGAQLRSLTDKASGQEILWQPTEGIWMDSAPWLFPLIGQLRGGSFRWQGRQYPMPMHGFAGKAAFALEKCSADEAVLSLEESEATLAVYPWKFRLETTVGLSGKRVFVRAKVVNKDAADMYFSIGAHPGLRCAIGDQLLMNNPSELPVYRLNEANHLLRNVPAETLPAHTSLTLEETLFDADAMLLGGGRVTELLLHRKSGRDVRFTCDETPWLGLWSRKRAGLPYVCIEPWFGVDDPEDASGDVTQKLDIQMLPPQMEFVMNYAMDILDREENEG